MYEIAKAVLGDKTIKKIALKKIRHFNKDILSLLEPNKSLSNVAYRNRCFIIGNGPSISNMDLSYLANESVFTCNYFAQSDQFLSLNPLAHFIMDTRFFLNENPDTSSPLQKTFNRCSEKKVKYLFLNSEVASRISTYSIDKSIAIHFIAQNPNASLENEINLCDYIPSFPTVIHSAIYTALYMGYKEIYLLGCDCTGFVSYASAHESKPVSSNYGFKIDNASEKIINKNMTSDPIQQELRWYAQIFDDYEALNKACLANNKVLINLTKGGVLNSIPRKSYEEVITK